MATIECIRTRMSASNNTYRNNSWGTPLEACHAVAQEVACLEVSRCCTARAEHVRTCIKFVPVSPDSKDAHTKPCVYSKTDVGVCDQLVIVRPSA